MESDRTQDIKSNDLDLSRLRLVLCVSPECPSLKPDLVLWFALLARRFIKAMLHIKQLHGWIPAGKQVGTCWPCSESGSGLCEPEGKGRLPQINPIYQSFC